MSAPCTPRSTGKVFLITGALLAVHGVVLQTLRDQSPRFLEPLGLFRVVFDRRDVLGGLHFALGLFALVASWRFLVGRAWARRGLVLFSRLAFGLMIVYGALMSCGMVSLVGSNTGIWGELEGAGAKVAAGAFMIVMGLAPLGFLWFRLLRLLRCLRSPEACAAADRRGF